MKRLFLVFILIILGIPALPAQAADAVIGSGTPASCTETEFDNALAVVQASAGGTITFDCGGAATISITAMKTISKVVTIQGAELITLHGGNSTRFFFVSPTGELILNDITLTDGYAANNDGGAIYNSGSLVLNTSTVRDCNTANPYSGGAIVSYGPLLIYDSLLENNSAGSGGAVYIRFEAGDATITNSTLRSNRTTNLDSGWGGAVLLWDGADLTVHGTLFENNDARVGGAIHNMFANSIMLIDQNSRFSTNHAWGTTGSSGGGGLYTTAGTATLTDVTFSSNTAAHYGGAIDNPSAGSLSLNRVFLVSNSAANGGGLFNSATATLSSVILDGNTATNSGGGILSLGVLNLVDSIFSSNSSGGEGGGLANYSTATLSRVTFSANTSTSGAGLMNMGTAGLQNVTFSANTAALSGGALLNSGVSNLTNVTLYNDSAQSGGSIYYQSGTVNLKNVILSAGAGDNCSGVAGYQTGIVSGGFNLANDSSCGLNQAGDVSNTPAQLDPLALNGGLTPTHMPRSGSPALDEGTSTGAPTTDQRSLPRPAGLAYDIGAVERQPGDQDQLQMFLALVLK